MDPLPYVTPTPDGVILDVFVQARAVRRALVGLHGGALKIKVTSPPAEGRANREVEGMLADLLGLPRSKVTVTRGAGSRNKRVKVTGRDPETVVTALAGVLSSGTHEQG